MMNVVKELKNFVVVREGDRCEVIDRSIYEERRKKEGDDISPLSEKFTGKIKAKWTTGIFDPVYTMSSRYGTVPGNVAIGHQALYQTVTIGTGGDNIGSGSAPSVYLPWRHTDLITIPDDGRYYSIDDTTNTNTPQHPQQNA